MQRIEVFPVGGIQTNVLAGQLVHDGLECVCFGCSRLGCLRSIFHLLFGRDMALGHFGLRFAERRGGSSGIALTLGQGRHGRRQFNCFGVAAKQRCAEAAKGKAHIFGAALQASQNRQQVFSCTQGHTEFLRQLFGTCGGVGAGQLVKRRVVTET